MRAAGSSASLAPRCPGLARTGPQLFRLLFGGSSANVSDEGGAAEQYGSAYVPPNLFPLIGQKSIVGRDFTADDDGDGAEGVVVLGNSIWKSRYGGDPSVLGRSIRIDGIAATVTSIVRDEMRAIEPDLPLFNIRTSLGLAGALGAGWFYGASSCRPTRGTRSRSSPSPRYLPQWRWRHPICRRGGPRRSIR